MKKAPDVSELDLLDRQLVHALMMDGRAPLNRLARVLNVTDRTVTSRYRRLRGRGILRVVGLPVSSRVGVEVTRLRIQCTPGNAEAIARALAHRADTGWVKIYASGTEVVCTVRCEGIGTRESLLLQKLLRARQVTAVAAQSVMQIYTPAQGTWLDLNALDSDQVQTLQRAPSPAKEPVVLGDVDHALLAVLSRDGRAGYSELAQAAGRSESTIRRRLDHLRRNGALTFEVEIVPSHFGLHTEAAIAACVAPHQLADTARALAHDPEVTWAAATTGPTNLVATVICHNREALYAYLTDRIGALKTINQLEIMPVLRHVKQLRLLTDGNRLHDRDRQSFRVTPDQ
ncbi:AsnC family transcriptional regulator [Streptomyces sioyaensis]|uniref:AsnC family transcriptional regulator n=1 Tax=Streptomyces sioyaensis TaxID=67364 RepID=UPI0037D5C87E